jgi:hypothetical protein
MLTSFVEKVDAGDVQCRERRDSHEPGGAWLHHALCRPKSSQRAQTRRRELKRGPGVGERTPEPSSCGARLELSGGGGYISKHHRTFG